MALCEAVGASGVGDAQGFGSQSSMFRRKKDKRKAGFIGNVYPD